MAWKRVKAEFGGIEWFNPDSRLRINLKKGSISGSYNIFVYRKRRAPPKEGKAPTFSKHFKDQGDAFAFMHKLIAVKDLDFNYLNQFKKRKHDKVLQWFGKIITDFFIQTAGFFRVSPGVFEREGVRLRVTIKETDSIGSMHIFITPVGKYSSLGGDIFLYFKNQNPLEDMKKDKAWYIDRINKLAKKVYWSACSIDIVKDEVGWAESARRSPLPKGFRRIDQHRRELEDKKK